MCVFPLHVADVPEMDGFTCPSNRTWVEGTQQMLHCLAKGNPKPSVACTKDSITHNVEKEEWVNQSHTGTYNCTAANDLGSSTKTVTILVECKWVLLIYMCVFISVLCLYIHDTHVKHAYKATVPKLCTAATHLDLHAEA